MRNTAVDVMDDCFFAFNLQANIQPQAGWIAHVQSNRLALKPRANNSGRCFERNLVTRVGNSVGESRETARAISTHLRLTPVRVVVAHPEIGAVCRFFEK